MEIKLTSLKSKNGSDINNKTTGFKKISLSIKQKKKEPEIKKSHIFDEKNFHKPFQEEIVYADDEKIQQTSIEELEDGRIRTINEEKEKTPLVIPLILTNQWRNNDNKSNTVTSNQQKNEEKENLDIQKNEKKNKKEISEVEEKMEAFECIKEVETSVDDTETHYGLQIQTKKKRKIKNDEDEDDEEKKEETKVEDETTKNLTIEEKAINELIKEANGGLNEENNIITNPMTIDAIPILKQNAVPGLNGLPSDEAKFKHDIELRPDETRLEDYERVPVEEFGAAMLRGMGWKGDQSGGKQKDKNRSDKPVEFKPRPALLGLGAKPLPVPEISKIKRGYHHLGLRKVSNSSSSVPSSSSRTTNDMKTNKEKDVLSTLQKTVINNHDGSRGSSRNSSRNSSVHSIQEKRNESHDSVRSHSPYNDNKKRRRSSSRSRSSSRDNHERQSVVREDKDEKKKYSSSRSGTSLSSSRHNYNTHSSDNNHSRHGSYSSHHHHHSHSHRSSSRRHH